MILPGFVNAHCHAFQRALRGRTEGGDFWGWRAAMLDVAQGVSLGEVRSGYAALYRELLGAGYTAVGEFHYLGFDSALAAADAAAEAGIELTLVYAAYAVPPFAQPSVASYLDDVEKLRAQGVRVGIAPHSVRACPPAWLTEIGRHAEREGLVLHVHASEQPREVDECIAAYGIPPIELLARNGCLGPHTTVVHATHASDAELDLIRDAGARICVCPTTEANLGDGFAPIERIRERGIGVCIGSDSNVRVDPLEELRELEGIARRHTLTRNVISADRLLAFGSDEGAGALGLESWPNVVVDTEHPSLAGIAAEDLLPALVFGCSAEVLSAEA
ncbi:MAG: amidohydrolase family protein [Gaiellaceae bacterium]